MKTDLINEIVETYSYFLKLAGIYETFDMRAYQAFLAKLPESKLVTLHEEIMQYSKLQSEQLVAKVKRAQGELRSMEEHFVSSEEKKHAKNILNF